MQKHFYFKQLYLPIIFLCGLLPGVSLASYSPPHNISLDAALQQASTQATELRRLRTKQQLASATQARAAQAFLPRISLESTWIRADADVLGNIPSINLRSTPPEITTQDYGPVEGSINAVNLLQPLIHIEGWKGHAQASTVVQARAAATEWGTQVLKLRTAQAYFGIHIQAKVLHAAQQAMHAARQALERANAHYSQGMVGKLDVTRARVEAQSTQARVFAAETEVNKAKNILADLLGLNPTTPLRVTTPLPHPLPPAAYPLPQQQRADITATELKLESAYKGVDKAQARILPKVSLLARQQWADGDAAFDDYADAWLVGVNMQWNLFEGLDRHGEIAEAEAHADLAWEDVTQKRRTAMIQQNNSLHNWMASWRAWEASRTAVKAAATAADLAARRYAEGLGNLTDVLLTRAELYQHRVDTCRYQYRTLLAGMNYYLYHGYSPLQGLAPQLSALKRPEKAFE